MSFKKVLEVILLVEDEPDHADLIKKALKDNGHLINEIFWVDNGEDALHFLRKTGKFENKNLPHPGLVLLDIKLPIKNGFEVLKEIKSDDKIKHIPVVVLTTSSNGDDVHKALELGANDYIVKPVNFSDFVKKVAKIGNYWAIVSDTNVNF